MRYTLDGLLCTDGFSKHQKDSLFSQSIANTEPQSISFVTLFHNRKN